MVRSATAWSHKDRALVGAFLGLWALAARHEFGCPVALLLLCAAPFVFGGAPRRMCALSARVALVKSTAAENSRFPLGAE